MEGERERERERDREREISFHRESTSFAKLMYLIVLHNELP